MYNVTNLLFQKHLWFVAALLYGLSWPLFPAFNFSFLAWFAFALFFIQLEKQNDFKKYISFVFLFLYLSHAIPFWWVFNIQIKKHLVFLATIQDTFIVSVPFIVLFFLKKKLPFTRALLLVGFFLPAWEWIYTELENTIGFMNIGYSQGNNIPFIQIANICGIYGISMVVWFLNVLIYLVYQNRKKVNDVLAYTGMFIFLVIFNYAYGLYSGKNIKEKGEITVCLLNTHYAPVKQNSNYWDEIFIDILHKTDAAILAINDKPDIIVWPESIVNDAWDSKKEILEKKVVEWKTPLLLGVKTYDGKNEYNQIKFIEEDGSSQFYSKIKLTPFWEGIPFLSRYYNFKGFLKPGDSSTNFQYDNQSFGTPICFELLYPSVWVEMKKAGATYFIHTSYESWFGKNWFQNVFTTMTRIRAVENGMTTIRCANGGPSGAVYPHKKEILCDQTACLIHIEILNKKSFLTSWYFVLPFFFFILFFALVIYSLKRQENLLQKTNIS